MAYLGKTPSQAVRSRYYYTATGGETSLSGSDDNSNVLTFTDGNYVDVYLNGVLLVAGVFTGLGGSNDYYINTTNTITLNNGLTASDVVEVIVYDTFSVFGGNMAANLNFKDNVKANFGTGNDLQIFHDGSNSIIRDAGTGSLKFQYGTSDGVVFDSSGNVGIGTSSPIEKITANGAVVSTASNSTGSTSGANRAILDFTSGGARIGHFRGTTAAGSGYASFYTDSAERMRIDSSGNLLVGKTSASGSSSAGHEFRSDGLLISAKNGVSGAFGRITTDGDIVQFAKDGSTVGSIGASGDDLVIGTGDTGIHFHDGVDSFIPWNISTASYRDAAIDLGTSSYRYKDLYLSGGVYLGGTGSANLLDDYEEGTWNGTLRGVGSDPTTPVIATGQYTKVGRKVYAEIRFSSVSNVGASGNVYVSGLPFTVNTAYASSGNCAAYLFDFPAGLTSISIQVSGTNLFPYVSGDSATWDVLQHAPGTARYLEISAQYTVA